MCVSSVGTQPVAHPAPFSGSVPVILLGLIGLPLIWLSTRRGADNPCRQGMLDQQGNTRKHRWQPGSYGPQVWLSCPLAILTLNRSPGQSLLPPSLKRSGLGTTPLLLALVSGILAVGCACSAAVSSCINGLRLLLPSMSITPAATHVHTMPIDWDRDDAQVAKGQSLARHAGASIRFKNGIYMAVHHPPVHEPCT